MFLNHHNIYPRFPFLVSHIPHMATKVNYKPSSLVTAATWLILCILVMICNVSLAERVLKEKEPAKFVEKETKGFLRAMVDFLWESGKSSYEPVWPVSS